MYFEEFNVGTRLEARPRMVTPTDIDLFAVVTGATNPIFLQDEAGKKMGYKGRIAPGLLTLSLTVGLSYQLGLVDHLIAFLGLDKVRFLAPVNPGDMLKSEFEATEKRETKQKDKGIIIVHMNSENQDGERVLEADMTFMIRRKE